MPSPYADMPYESLVGRLEVLEIEIQDKRETIQQLKDALMDARDSEQKSVESAVRHANQQFERIQDDLQRRLTSQLRMIDRLTNDKMELTRQIEVCANEIGRLKERNEIDIRNAAEDALRNADKTKKLTAAQEKAQREAWEKKKEEEIKERTVRALEPQIDTILQEQKALRRRLESKFEEEKENLARRFNQELQEGVRKAREEARQAAEDEIEAARKGFLERSRQEFEAAQKLLDDERDAHVRLLAQERDRHSAALRVAQEEFRRKLDLATEDARMVLEPQLESLKAALKASEEARLTVENAMEVRQEAVLRERVEEVRAALQKDAEHRLFDVKRAMEEDFNGRLQQVSSRLAEEMNKELVQAQRQAQVEIDRVKMEAEGRQGQLVDALRDAKENARRQAENNLDFEGKVDELEGQIHLLQKQLKEALDRATEAEVAASRAHADAKYRENDLEARLEVVKSSMEAAQAEERRDLEYKISGLQKNLLETKATVERLEAALASANEEASQKVRSAEERMKIANEANVRALQISESKCVHLQALLDRQRAELLGKLRAGRQQRPIHLEYENDLNFKQKAQKIRHRKNHEEDVEEVIPEKISKKIMGLARRQEESDVDSDVEGVDVDKDGFVTLEDAFGDEEELAMQMFLGAPQEGGIRTLADLIAKRVEDQKNGVRSAPVLKQPEAKGNTVSLAELMEQAREDEEAQKAEEMSNLPAKAILTLKEVGVFLSKYKSGKLPIICKQLPLMELWEEAVHYTDPANWTPHAMREMVKYFSSSLNPRMAQRFYNLVVLPNIRSDIAENKKLNVHHYAALKKAMFKPDAWMKGILLPLAADAPTLKEANIIASVVAKLSIPVAHAAAAMLKLAEMTPWIATHSFFLGVLINKKYSLPYSVLEGLVKHFHSFVNDERVLPVAWHKAFLYLVQRYKFEFNQFQRQRILETLRKHLHPSIGPEIRRELQSVNALVAVSAAGMEIE